MCAGPARSSTKGAATDANAEDGRHVEYRPLSEVVPAVRNPKRHNINGIRTSIARFGFTTPALLDERTGRLVAGHGRLAALTAMRDAGEQPPAGVRLEADGWLVPIICGWASRSDAEAEAYLVADNRHTELGGWDDEELGALLAAVGEVDPDLVAIAGYADADLAALQAAGDATELPPVGAADPDDVLEAPPDPVTHPGDVWLLGPHRVICGDCRDSGTVMGLLDGARINVAFTSPPYADRRVYDESSGFRPIPPADYVEWFRDVAANVRAHLADDGSWFVNIKPSVTPDGLDTELYVFDLVIAHVREWGWHFATEFCWERRGVPKAVTRRFKNQFEPIYQFAVGAWKTRPDAVRHESDDVPRAGGPGVGSTSWADTTQRGKTHLFGAGRKRRNGGRGGWGGVSKPDDVQGTNWQPGEFIGPGLAYPGNRLSAFSTEATGHTAAFPVGLPAWFLRAYSDPGDAVFDPFMGSGSTLIAAHQEQRVAYGCEISPAYVDLICRRYQEHTGAKPVLADTGQPHDFIGAG